MKVYLKGSKTSTELLTSDFLAAGGEGKIYLKGTTVYKIFDDPSKIPNGKFAELSVLTDRNIIKPEQILVDNKNKTIGYTMRFVKDSYTLCQLFTNAFRTRNNIKHDTMFDLICQMQKTIKHIHSNNILIVDLNELNFLVDDKFKNVYFIDVNSYQTSSYPATAIMDSIRDRHNAKFSELTDWFSFAIISFQMFVGIHPYKGKHAKYTDLESRMKNNVSVLNKQVSYPAVACQSFSIIPDNYLRWYNKVLEKGERLPPPDDTIQVNIIVPTVKITGTKTLVIDKIREFPETLIKYYNDVFITSTKIYVDKKEYASPAEKVYIGFTRTNKPIIAWLDNEIIKLMDLTTQKEIPFICNASKLMDYEGRIYAQNSTNIIEIQFVEIKDNILASPHIVATVLEHSAKFYDGVIVQNLFDAHYVSIFPESKQCQQIALRELDGLKVIDAKYENKILMIVAVDSKGSYNKYIYSFKEWSSHTLIEKKNIHYCGLNFVVLDNDICISINEDENIELFRNIDLGNIKVVQDDIISQDMVLTHKDATVMFIRGNELYSMKMK